MDNHVERNSLDETAIYERDRLEKTYLSACPASLQRIYDKFNSGELNVVTLHLPESYRVKFGSSPFDVLKDRATSQGNLAPYQVRNSGGGWTFAKQDRCYGNAYIWFNGEGKIFVTKLHNGESIFTIPLAYDMNELFPINESDIKDRRLSVRCNSSYFSHPGDRKNINEALHDKKKYYNKTITRLIAKPLKPYGFRKHNSNTILRLTDGNILQGIIFDKSRSGIGGFYVEYINKPIQFVSQHSGLGGPRTGNFSKALHPQNFALKVTTDYAFEEIKKQILTIILPWFDATSDVAGTLAMHDAMIKHEKDERKQRSCPSIYDRKELGYLYIANKLWGKAREQISSIRYPANAKPGVSTHCPEDCVELVALIDNKDYTAIEAMEIATKSSLWQVLKLDKYTVFTPEKGNHQEQFFNVFGEQDQRSIIPGQGASYHHWLSIESWGTFHSLKSGLEKFAISRGYTFRVIEDTRVIINISDSYHFHIDFNTFEWVGDDCANLASVYLGVLDTNKIKSLQRRVDFWADYDHGDEHQETYNDLLEYMMYATKCLAFNPSTMLFYDEFLRIN